VVKEEDAPSLFVLYLRPLIEVTSSNTTLTADEEQPTPVKKPKKSKHIDIMAVDADYSHYGHTIGHFLGPFGDVTQIIEYGTTANCMMSGDEGETE
jgi:hypothetical protein